METLKLFCKAIKVLCSRIMESYCAECTIPAEALETIARCVMPDIIKYYEEKRNEKSEPEPLTHLTKEAV